MLMALKKTQREFTDELKREAVVLLRDRQRPWSGRAALRRRG